MTDERTVNTQQDQLPDWLEQATGNDDNNAPQQVQQRFSSSSILLMVLALAVLLVVGYAFYQQQTSGPAEGAAPEFSINVWELDGIARSGETLTLDGDLAGKTVVLNFWASWCGPCRAEAPMFERVWQDYAGNNVVFLGVNTEDTDVAVIDYIDEFRLTYPHAPDQGGRMEDEYGVTGIPETFIINGNGDITKHFISTPNERDLRAEIDRALES